MTLNDLGGQTIQVSDRAPLMLHTSAGWVIVIESALVVSGPGEASREMEGDAPDAAEAMTGRLNGLAIRTAAIDGETLDITFAGDVRVRVEPDPDFEAWSVTAPDGKRTVCMPGGKLAVWS